MGISEKLFEIAKSLIEALGYGGLIFGLIVDSAGIPIPSEVLIPLAGALAREGTFSLPLVIIFSTLAQTLGAILAYWIGARGGVPFIKRWGKYVLFSEHELEKTQKLFDKSGRWITLIGRCLPGIRTYIGYPAGIAKMPFVEFVVYSFIGSFLWTILLALVGYYLADQIHLIDQVLGKVGILLAVVAAVAFIWYIKHSRKKRARA